MASERMADTADRTRSRSSVSTISDASSSETEDITYRRGRSRSRFEQERTISEFSSPEAVIESLTHELARWEAKDDVKFLPYLLQSLLDLGVALFENGENEKAEPLLQRCRNRMLEVWGWSGTEPHLCVKTLTAVLLALDRADDAFQLHEEAYSAVRRILGREHPWTLQYQNNKGHFYVQTKDWEEAENCFQEAATAKLHVFGENHYSTLNSFYNLDLVSYLRDGDVQEFQVMVSFRLGSFRRLYGDRARDTEVLARQLISLYYKTENTEAAYQLADDLHIDIGSEDLSDELTEFVHLDAIIPDRIGPLIREGGNVRTTRSMLETMLSIPQVGLKMLSTVAWTREKLRKWANLDITDFAHLMQLPGNIDWSQFDDATAMLKAAAELGHEPTIRSFLEKRKRQLREDGRVPDVLRGALHRGSLFGNETVVRLLLEQGVTVDAQNRDGQTALYSAVQNGHERVIQTLLEFGADPVVRDRFGLTPLDDALKDAQHPIIRLLMEARGALIISYKPENDVASRNLSDKQTPKLKAVGLQSTTVDFYVDRSTRGQEVDEHRVHRDSVESLLTGDKLHFEVDDESYRGRRGRVIPRERRRRSPIQMDREDTNAAALAAGIAAGAAFAYVKRRAISKEKKYTPTKVSTRVRLRSSSRPLYRKSRTIRRRFPSRSRSRLDESPIRSPWRTRDRPPRVLQRRNRFDGSDPAGNLNDGKDGPLTLREDQLVDDAERGRTRFRTIRQPRRRKRSSNLRGVRSSSQAFGSRRDDNPRTGLGAVALRGIRPPSQVFGPRRDGNLRSGLGIVPLAAAGTTSKVRTGPDKSTASKALATFAANKFTTYYLKRKRSLSSSRSGDRTRIRRGLRKSIKPVQAPRTAHGDYSASDFRWIHLPANNMEWIEAVMEKLRLESREGTKFPNLLKDELWRRQQHESVSTAVHSRFMKPSCRVVSGENGDDSMVLFMPYIHWETEPERDKLQSAVDKYKRKPKGRPLEEGLKLMVKNFFSENREESEAKQHQPLERHELSDKRLVKLYLNFNPPLHIRRTLDQFHYYMTENTTDRDSDQVISRYFKRKYPSKPPPIMMVDQLWLWIVNKETIVTSFPQRWGQHPSNSDAGGTVDMTNVLDSILQHLKLRTRDPLTSVFGLAELIVGRCLGLNYNAMEWAYERYPYLEIFEYSINSVADEETRCFNAFADNDRKHHTSEKAERARKRTWVSTLGDEIKDIFDISREIDLLKEIKDVRDELNIMRHLFSQQRTVLDSFLPAIDNALKLHGCPSSGKKPKMVDAIDRQARYVESLDKDAKRPYKALEDLLDLKQKQANVSEARSARISGNSITVFTIVTIIFLPASFMASFFALPITQYPKIDDNFELSYVLKYLVAITVVLAVPFIVLALYVNPIIRIFRASLRSSYNTYRVASKISRIVFIALKTCMQFSAKVVWWQLRHLNQPSLLKLIWNAFRVLWLILVNWKIAATSLLHYRKEKKQTKRKGMEWSKRRFVIGELIKRRRKAMREDEEKQNAARDRALSSTGNRGTARPWEKWMWWKEPKIKNEVEDVEVIERKPNWQGNVRIREEY